MCETENAFIIPFFSVSVAIISSIIVCILVIIKKILINYVLDICKLLQKRYGNAYYMLYMHTERK